MQKKYLYTGGVVVITAVVLFFIFYGKDLSNKIVFPYITHQKPKIDPHLPHSVSLSDKLDEVLYDGLFNVMATPSGETYQDGLGELMSLEVDNIVTIRLKPDKKWHSSYKVSTDDNTIAISQDKDIFFLAQDLRFTLRRIQKLGSLSPDYILVSQALEQMEFEGPDANNEIKFNFKDDRLWKEDEIKEVLSFKILPYNSEINAPSYPIGTGPYLLVPQVEGDVTWFYKNPAENANIANVILQPFVDNSTFVTELHNNNINVLLEPPFGSLSPLLEEEEDYFAKSNISNTFFALLFNTQRLSREQRYALRDFIETDLIVKRFYKINSEQQRHIKDYKGNKDNYDDYLNYSIFPSSSYYVEEKIVAPRLIKDSPDLSVLPDSIRIQACLNYGFREEYSELIEILNDASLFGKRLRVTAVNNNEISKGNYDALLIAITGYKSTFLFDLYDILLREPNPASYKINLNLNANGSINPSSLQPDKNFFRLDANQKSSDQKDILELLDYVYGFMSTPEVGDRQKYAELIDQKEQQLALGKWIFSLPSLAYLSRQFDEKSVDLYGKASQLSTIERWKENKDY